MMADRDRRRLWVVEIREDAKEQWRATACIAEVRRVARMFVKQFPYCQTRVRCYIPREEKVEVVGNPVKMEAGG